MKAVHARGLDIADIRREDFPLPTLGPVLDRLRAEVLDGRGFALLRGMPVEDRPIAESATAYWGVGTQNAQGHHPGLPPHDGGLARVSEASSPGIHVSAYVCPGLNDGDCSLGSLLTRRWREVDSNSWSR